MALALVGVVAFAGCDDATAPAGPASGARVVAVPGASAVGLVAYSVNVPPRVRVVDSAGAPMAGVAVHFTSVGGSIAGGARVTGLDGVAGVETWTLAAGQNTVTANVPGAANGPIAFHATGVSGDYDVSVRAIGALSATQRQIVDRAVARWKRVIYRDLPTSSVSLAAGACGRDAPALNESIEDVLILVQVGTIDGPGGVIGSGGVCALRAASLLPLVGVIILDTADADGLEASGHLEALVMHELGHALGFGTVWPALGLLADPTHGGGVDPHFTGADARTEFERVGGQSYRGLKVPVEDGGGPGTADAHWRESVFASELMTGYLSYSQNPMSIATVAAMGDLGYTVNYAGADTYVLGAAAPANPVSGSGRAVGDDILRGRIHHFDTGGRLTRIVDQR